LLWQLEPAAQSPGGGAERAERAERAPCGGLGLRLELELAGWTRRGLAVSGGPSGSQSAACSR